MGRLGTTAARCNVMRLRIKVARSNAMRSSGGATRNDMSAITHRDDQEC